MSVQAGCVAKLDVGTPSSKYQEWETIEVRFHEFANLTTPRHEQDSPEFKCCGHKWRLRIYPGGFGVIDGQVAIFLYHMSNESIDVIWRVTVRNQSTGAEVAHDDSERDIARRHFEARVDGADMNDMDGADSWGQHDFAKRRTLLGALVDGTLIIEVRMKLVDAPDSASPMAFIPDNPLSKNILNKFMDEESADVMFEVGSKSEEEGNTGKRVKTSTTFYAHRLILQDGATMLDEMCKSDGKSNAISITDVSPEIFRHLLYYVYGGKVSVEELKANAKEIIDAADRYGVVNLKLEAEAYYVKSITITLENAIDNFLYADSKNCALLKEAVMDFLVEHGNEAQKLSFDNVPSSAMKDLLSAMNRKRAASNQGGGNSDNLTTMRVSDLRKKLHEKGMDVDGSREMMITRLEESSIRNGGM